MAKEHEAPQGKEPIPLDQSLTEGPDISFLMPNTSISLGIGEVSSDKWSLEVFLNGKPTQGDDDQEYCVIDQEDLIEKIKAFVESQSGFHFRTMFDIEAEKADKLNEKNNKTMENVFLIEIGPEYLSTVKAIAAFKNLSDADFLSRFIIASMKSIKVDMENAISLNLNPEDDQ